MKNSNKLNEHIALYNEQNQIYNDHNSTNIQVEAAFEAMEDAVKRIRLELKKEYPNITDREEFIKKNSLMSDDLKAELEPTINSIKNKEDTLSKDVKRDKLGKVNIAAINTSDFKNDVKAKFALPFQVYNNLNNSKKDLNGKSEKINYIVDHIAEKIVSTSMNLNEENQAIAPRNKYGLKEYPKITFNEVLDKTTTNKINDLLYKKLNNKFTFNKDRDSINKEIDKILEKRFAEIKKENDSKMQEIQQKRASELTSSSKNRVKADQNGKDEDSQKLWQSKNVSKVSSKKDEFIGNARKAAASPSIDEEMKELKKELNEFLNEDKKSSIKQGKSNKSVKWEEGKINKNNPHNKKGGMHH